MKPTTNFDTESKRDYRVKKHADFLTLRRSVTVDCVTWYEDGEIEIGAAALYRNPDAQTRVENALGVGIETFTGLRGQFYAPDGTLVTRGWLRTRGTRAGMFLVDYENKMLVPVAYGGPVRYYDETSYPRSHATICVRVAGKDDDKVRARLHDLVAVQMMAYKLGGQSRPAWDQDRARANRPAGYNADQATRIAHQARAWIFRDGASIEGLPDQYGGYTTLQCCARAVAEKWSVERVVRSVFDNAFVLTREVSFLTWK